MNVGYAAAGFSVLSVALSPISNARAVELQVIAGGGIADALREAGKQFESSSGHRLVFRFGTTPELIRLATSGSLIDLGVVPREVFNDAAARAQFVSGQNPEIARVGHGVAVRTGARKPDISTPEALKATLLEAQSIATVPESAAGAQVLRTFERLGISDAVKAKLKAQPSPAQMVQAVANGEAELGVFLANVLTAPGLDLVGPFPAELQQEIVYVAGIAGNSKEADASKAFVSFLTGPAGKALIKAKGLTPS